MTGAFLALLDRETAGALAMAIRFYEQLQKRRGEPCPQGLVDLRDLAIEIQNRTDPDINRDADRAPAYGGDDDSQLLTQRTVAEELGVDARTVRRWLDKGVLAAVNVGPACRRISRGELDRFIASRGSG